MLSLLMVLIKVVSLLIAIAYFTIAERKVMAAIQRRRGPNRVGFWGLLQPFADALKLLGKEFQIPEQAAEITFLISPIIILSCSLVVWNFAAFSFVEEGELLSKVEVASYMASMSISRGAIAGYEGDFFSYDDSSSGVLMVLIISSYMAFHLVLAGWASSSKYTFLGALRSSAQLVSYEVSLTTALLPVIMFSNSLELVRISYAQDIFGWFVWAAFPIATIFFISGIAETNRTPFDLPEAEAELVAGYNLEYMSIVFALFFLAEYNNMSFMSLLFATCFFGGSLFSRFAVLLCVLKINFFNFMYILVRTALPRYRFDQLMLLGWKVFLPVVFGFFVLSAGTSVLVGNFEYL
jgi:NADH-quinone oxidoreductase subunit H